MTATRRGIVFNCAITYVRLMLSLVLGIIVTRVALRTLAGDPETAQHIFGVGSLLVALIGTVLFLTEAMLKSVTRQLSIAFTEADPQAVRRVISNASSAGVLTATLTVVFTCVLASAGSRIFAIPADLRQVGFWALISGGAFCSLTALCQPWLASFYAREQFTLVNLLALTQQLGTLAIISIIPLTPLPPIILFVAAFTLPQASVALFAAIILAIASKEFRPSVSLLDRAILRDLSGVAGWGSVIGLASNLYERTDQICINLFFGPASNAIYASVQQLGGMVSRCVTASSEVLLPAASRLHAVGSVQDARHLVTRTMRYALLVTIPIILLIVTFRHQIINTWLGAHMHEAANVLPMAMLLVLLRVPNFVAWTYLTAINKLKWPAIAIVIDAVINVICSIAYVKLLGMGLNGILLGSVTTNVIRFIAFQQPYVAWHLGLSIWEFWARTYLRPLVGAVWLGPSLWLLSETSAPTMLVWAGVGLLLSVYATFSWVFIFEGEERSQVRVIIERVRCKFGARQTPDAPPVTVT